MLAPDFILPHDFIFLHYINLHINSGFNPLSYCFTHTYWLYRSKREECIRFGSTWQKNNSFSFSITFSFCISLFKTEILIFISSISCSGRTWILGQESESSRVWKVKSARGMYHLHSYCWWRLQMDRKEEESNNHTTNSCSFFKAKKIWKQKIEHSLTN